MANNNSERFRKQSVFNNTIRQCEGGAMKKRPYWFIPILVLVFACNLQTATVSVIPPVVSSAPTSPGPAQAGETPTVTLTPTISPNVSCKELTLTLDTVLAASFQCQTVPAAGAPDDPYFAINPQYTEVTFQGYVLPSTFHQPHVSSFPVRPYSALIPGVIDARVTALQQLIAGGAPPAKGALPLLPIFNAAEEFRAQYKVIAFSGGNGIRYLTQYAQFFDPINSHDMLYSFQGLTGDGKHWISAILPISNSMLPPNGDNPPGGLTWDQFSNQFVTYIADLTEKLNNQPPESYSPTIAALDALISSIAVHP
jgi:hypothetical protein